MKTKPNKLTHIHRDRGYRFTDRDPVMLEVCNLITASGQSVEEIRITVSRVTKGTVNLGSGTIYKWMSGQTKRPQNYTLTWVLYALGYERKLIPIK